MSCQHRRTNTSDSDADLRDWSPPFDSSLPFYSMDSSPPSRRQRRYPTAGAGDYAPAESHPRRTPSPSRFYRLLSDFQQMKANYTSDRERFATRKKELAEAKTKASRYRDERDASRQEVCQLRADNAMLAHRLKHREAAVVNAAKRSMPTPSVPAPATESAAPRPTRSATSR